MALPKVALSKRRMVILLSGYKNEGKDETRKGVVIDAKDKLVIAAKRNPDAVAFGFVAGEWVASA
jgi:hypothetical protein